MRLSDAATVEKTMLSLVYTPRAIVSYPVQKRRRLGGRDRTRTCDLSDVNRTL